MLHFASGCDSGVYHQWAWLYLMIVCHHVVIQDIFASISFLRRETAFPNGIVCQSVSLSVRYFDKFVIYLFETYLIPSNFVVLWWALTHTTLFWINEFYLSDRQTVARPFSNLLYKKTFAWSPTQPRGGGTCRGDWRGRGDWKPKTNIFQHLSQIWTIFIWIVIWKFDENCYVVVGSWLFCILW